jgi:hypothetical protein
MRAISRRSVLRAGVGAAAAGLLGIGRGGAAVAAGPESSGAPGAQRVAQDATVTVLHPRDRVPLGFIIDDSTCLVNMGAYCMPQFRTAWPQNPIYWKKWKEWPREIPNDFVREFGEFCAGQGVRGKYSLVPYPACVGWLDRDLPGWPRSELRDSLKLVRELMAPSWDITPEMVTHTRVIDLKTGRPMEDFTPAAMENSYPPQRKSADELAAYIAHALRILKNCEIPCDGITTPGGFGNAAKSELSLGVRQAVADVYGPEIPFYFKYISEGKESTQPRLEHVEGADTEQPKLVVSVPAGTGDWFGNWDGDNPPQGQKYISEDGTAGRMAELIESGEPAVMFGHWAGLYSHGTKKGFEACKRVITTINQRFKDRTVWMKNTEMARYWAARELTKIERAGERVMVTAPFACPMFTVRVKGARGVPKVGQGALAEVKEKAELKAGTWMRHGEEVVVCWDLGKGKTEVGV